MTCHKDEALKAIFDWLCSVKKLDPDVQGLDAVTLFAHAALSRPCQHDSGMFKMDYIDADTVRLTRIAEETPHD